MPTKAIGNNGFSGISSILPFQTSVSVDREVGRIPLLDIAPTVKGDFKRRQQ